MPLERATEIPTIDVVLVTFIPNDGTQQEYGFDTASQISVAVQTDVVDAVRLVIKGQLKAQKLETSTITGNQITLTDNVFTPEVVLMLQGGTITYDTLDPTKIIGYTPPVAGSTDKGMVFTLNAYSAQYDASGQIVQYERIEYPNCQGTPVSINSQDNVFRAPEYVINSAPTRGQAPYDITYIDTLPTLP